MTGIRYIFRAFSMQRNLCFLSVIKSTNSSPKMFWVSLVAGYLVIMTKAALAYYWIDRCTQTMCGHNFMDEKALISQVSEEHIGRKVENNLCLTCSWDGCAKAVKRRDHNHLRVHIFITTAHVHSLLKVVQA
jgi:hypothetical protein